MRLKYYRDGLGWKPSSASQDYIIFFDLGCIGLSLYPRNLLAEDANVSPEGTDFSGTTLAHNAKSIEEFDTVLLQAEKAGAKTIKKTRKVFWGGYSGYFAKPDSYLWEVSLESFSGI